MIVFWVGAGAGLLAGWACGWAVTSWWRDRRDGDRINPPWWWKPWLRFRGGDQDDYTDYDDDDGELPPERSREELGFTGPQPSMDLWSGLGPQRERRAPWYEAEHRAAYESLGFDYPSGLMTRVRERLSA